MFIDKGNGSSNGHRNKLCIVTLQQLRYFLAVVRHGSFTRAAEEEGVAQPSLSQQIQRLEHSLGAPLFERSGRTIRLTPCGQQLLPYARQVLEQLEDAQYAVRRLIEHPCGPLHVGSIPTVTPYWLAPLVPEFQRVYPQVELRLHEDITAHLLNSLLDGHLQMAIVSLPIRNPDLICAELFREPIFVALPEDHPLGRQPVVPVAELRAERLLVLHEGHCFRENTLTVCRRFRFQPPVVFEGDHLGTLLSLVAAGYGVSMVPACAVQKISGCCFRPLNPPAVRRIGYVRRRRRLLLPAERVFTSWLKRAARQRLESLCQAAEAIAAAQGSPQ